MPTDRRFKLIGQGLPGVTDFDISDLESGDAIIWDEDIGKWIIGVSSGDGGNVGDSQYAVKIQDQSRNTTTTVADDSELTLSLAFESRFTFEASIKITSTNTQGFRFKWVGPSTMSYRYVATDVDGTNVLSSGNAQIDEEITITDVGTDQIINFMGSISSFGAKILAFQWAQETSDATDTTVREDSWIRTVRLTPLEGDPPPATLDEFIATLTPEYWWDFQEALAADTYVDSGAATTKVDMNSIVGTAPPIITAAPTTSNQSRGWGTSAGNWARTNPGLPILGGTTGTLVAFFRISAGQGVSGETWFSCDSADETNNIAFGWGARGVGIGAYVGRFSIVFLNNGNFTTYRAIVADSTIATLGYDDDAWHQIIFAYNGSAYSITVDTTVLAVSTFTSGTPVGNDTWFENNISPTRTFMGNGRYSNSSENFGEDMGPFFVLKNAVMTTQQIATMFNYL